MNLLTYALTALLGRSLEDVLRDAVLAPLGASSSWSWHGWLNDQRKPWPAAPATGRGARGNGGRHLLWIDPARDLVLCSRWNDDAERLLADVSACVTPA